MLGAFASSPLRGIVAGLIYSNASEWVAHKYILHGLGRKKDSFFAFHWHEHHKRARKADMRDEDYERSAFGVHAQGKEVFLLAASSALAAAVIGRRYPWFTATAIFGAWNYYRVHKKAHLDPAWAREHCPWHVDHHMGPDQDANWCVTHPAFDILLGTRKPYVGTELETKHRAQAEERARKKASVATAGEPEAVATAA
jgi:hypothetical protein